MTEGASASQQQQQQQQRRPPARRDTPPQSAPHEANVPVERPYSERDEYPLLTLPQRNQSRQSPAPSSLLVERSTAGDSGRTSVGLPLDQARGRISFQHDYAERSPTPGPSMSVAPDAAPQHAESHDVEAGNHLPPPASQGGRVSLPGSGRTSLSRTRSQRTDGDGDDASEYPWGPSHPCFPHPNPHVPLGSELYETTRIVRIKRDWMVKGDLAPTFANLYPEILDPLISEDDFRDVVKKINDSLVAAFDPFTFRAWLDTVMGIATFWLWDDVGMTGVKRQLKELENWIDRWNREVGQKEAVKIIPLRRTGYLTVRQAVLYLTRSTMLTSTVAGYPDPRSASWSRQRHTVKTRNTRNRRSTEERRLRELHDPHTHFTGQFYATSHREPVVAHTGWLAMMA